jgi:hypothetical protein
MEHFSRTVTVTQVDRPERKLIYLRYKATNYFDACEEVGCAWEDFYNQLEDKFDTAAGGRLPDALIESEKGTDAFFVEVPLSFDQAIPAGYEVAILPPATYLYFQGMPFEDTDAFPNAIGVVNEAIEHYPYAKYGWVRSTDAPVLGMGASPHTGARTAIPVRKIETM